MRGGPRPPSQPKHSRSSPPSPSSSSSEFEFSVSISPRKASSTLCPADELFYKGQLLPLQLSPRLSLVRTLCSSDSSSSSSAATSGARDSTGSSSSTDSTASFPLLHHPPHDCCDSSRPSSVTDDDDFFKPPKKNQKSAFSLSRFSAVFKKDPKNVTLSAAAAAAPSPVKRMSSTAREVIRKYMKKVKPLYDKLSQKQQQQGIKSTPSAAVLKTEMSFKDLDFPRKKDSGGSNTTAAVSGLSVTFSGNLRYPRRGRCAASCPSSMRSSPSHSGVLSRNGFPVAESGGKAGTNPTSVYSGGNNMSSMEELQSAIQGAIAHCKNSMLQKNNSLVSLEI